MKIDKKRRQASQTTIFFFAAFDYFGIDEWPGLLSGQLQEDHALGYPELRGGDAAAVCGGGTPVGEGMVEN